MRCTLVHLASAQIFFSTVLSPFTHVYGTTINRKIKDHHHSGPMASNYNRPFYPPPSSNNQGRQNASQASQGGPGNYCPNNQGSNHPGSWRGGHRNNSSMDNRANYPRDDGGTNSWNNDRPPNYFRGNPPPPLWTPLFRTPT